MSDERFTRETLMTAGKQPPLPADDIAAIRNAANATWQAHYANRERRRWILPVAAALIAGLILTVWTVTRPGPIQPSVPSARVGHVSGTVLAWHGGAQGSPITTGAEMPTGAVVETRQGRAMLLLNNDRSIRIDTDTRVRLTSSSLVELHRGGLYLESPPGASSESLIIRTRSGDFSPVGTQFEIRVGDGEATTLLRVREGRVRLDQAAGSVTTEAGEELMVRGDGSLVRRRLGADASSWGWITAAAGMPEIEGRSLESFLNWISREKGWNLKFADDNAKALSASTILHGSVKHLTPEQALDTVTLSAGFTYRVSDGTILISAP